MSLEELVRFIQNSTQHSYIYHFTDEANFPTIKSHGLLSKDEMKRQGIEARAPAGNDWSWEADDHKGISDHISLCFTRNHPMCHVVKTEKRIEKPRYLGVLPEILLSEGALFSFDIANKSGVVPIRLKDALPDIDIEVLYTRTDWHDAKIRSRLSTAERYELLVPKRIPVSKIKAVF